MIDGFEHLVDACAGWWGSCSAGHPGLRVLAAGRRPLRVAANPPAGAAERRRRGLALFARRAAAGRPGFVLTGATDVAELCRRLDGIPLAVELAAGRLRALSPAQLLSRLDDRFALLTGGRRDALPRHQTLRTAIGWSHELCTPSERLLWARLSVFGGPFDLEAAEYICSGAGLPADAVLDVLGELLAQSVVTREEGPTGVRYRMLDTVRAYGAEWLRATGDAERLRRGTATGIWGSPPGASWTGSAPGRRRRPSGSTANCPTCAARWSTRMRARTRRIWASTWRAGSGSTGSAAGGSRRGGTGWTASWSWSRPRHSRLKALWVLGYVAVLQGDTVAAMAALQECREEAERTGNAIATAYAVHRIGCLALRHRRHGARGDAAALGPRAATGRSASSTATS